MNKEKLKKFKKHLRSATQGYAFQRSRSCANDFGVCADDRYDEIDQATTDIEQSMRMRLRNREIALHQESRRSPAPYRRGLLRRMRRMRRRHRAPPARSSSYRHALCGLQRRAGAQRNAHRRRPRTQEPGRDLLAQIRVSYARDLHDNYEDKDVRSPSVLTPHQLAPALHTESDKRTSDMFHAIGFVITGFIVGLLARAIMPGKDKMGILATTFLGIVGAFLAGFLARLRAGARSKRQRRVRHVDNRCHRPACNYPGHSPPPPAPSPPRRASGQPAGQGSELSATCSLNNYS